MAFRSDYLEAVRVLAAVFDVYEAHTGSRPVLVGGAAVEYYSAGEITSGDFDIVAADDAAFARALASQGFRPEDRPGHVQRGFYHEQLNIGVELVSGLLFDGRTDRRRISLIPVESRPRVPITPVEDLIADRLAQFEASQRKDREMLEQARILYKVAQKIDLAYLQRRIHEEQGDFDLLQAKADDANSAQS